MTRIFKSVQMLAEHIHRRQSFKRRHISAAGHHHVWFAPRSLLAHSQMPSPPRSA